MENLSNYYREDKFQPWYQLVKYMDLVLHRSVTKFAVPKHLESVVRISKVVHYRTRAVSRGETLLDSTNCPIYGPKLNTWPCRAIRLHNKYMAHEKNYRYAQNYKNKLKEKLYEEGKHRETYGCHLNT